MENYYKGKNVEEELERDKIPFQNLPDNFLWMQVKGGSKMNSLLSHASGILEDKAATAIVWSGAGVGIPKAISCAEILKRQFSIQHQVTKLTHKRSCQYSNDYHQRLRKYPFLVLEIRRNTHPSNIHSIVEADITDVTPYFKNEKLVLSEPWVVIVGVLTRSEIKAWHLIALTIFYCVKLDSIKRNVFFAKAVRTQLMHSSDFVPDYPPRVQTVEEYWEPKMDGLETIVVKREIPVIHILLSINILEDSNQLGYQTLQGKNFWQESTSVNSKHSSYKSKKPFKHKQTPINS